MALDVTGSMNQKGKISALRNSAKDLIESLFLSDEADVKIGIVPFAQYVNLGASYAGQSWLTVPSGPSWMGCVGSRDYPNNVEDDDYVAEPAPGLNGIACPDPLMPLSTDEDALKDKIDDLDANGWTYIPSGLMWAWSLLTPGAPFSEGISFAELREGNGSKAIIVMTDGENTRAPDYPTHNSASEALANDLTEELCINIKAQDIITGSAAAIADEMCENPKLRKITFTGSTEIGKSLASKAMLYMKRVSMELGGNAPVIIFDDADLDRAVEGAMISKYRNSGQTCVCANRILVQAGVYDRFAEKFAAAAKKLRVGDGLDDGVEQGPLIDDSAVVKVEQHIEDATAKGAKIIAGGKRHAKGLTFFEPTVLRDVTPQMLIAKDETFGPVAPLFKFETEEEAIRMANDTEYGLASYFFTKDLARAFRVMEKLEYGMVAINEGILSTEVAPFGGVKESGLGREGSKYGIEDYVHTKYALVGGLK